MKLKLASKLIVGARWKLAGLLLFAVCSCSAARPKLFVQSTKNIEVLYYSPAHEYLVTHLIRSYENALQFEKNLFHYVPSERLSVLLEDFGDYGHGAAGSVPSDFINVGIAPFSYTYETLPANERMTWIMNHESIHIVMGDNANQADRRFRSVFFGKVSPNTDDPISMLYSFLTNPRFYSTRWFHEGIAAYMETWMSGGLGRALGGYDEMVFRAMVRDDAYIYNVVGLESEGTAVDFQTGANSYLYGTRFMTWLSKTYGTQKLLAWITRGENTKRYFASGFGQVYGMSLEDAWKLWIQAERKWQDDNLKVIRKYPVTEPQRISAQALGSVSRAYYDSERNLVYAAVRSPGQMANIAAIHLDTGEIEHLKNVKGPGLYYVTSLAFDQAGGKLFYTTDNNDWRDLNVLDLKTNHAVRLMKDNRTGDLAFNTQDRTLWGVSHNNGLSSLVEIPAPYDKVKVVHTFDYGQDLFDLDVSPDGQFLTGALGDLSGKQKLVRFSIERLHQGDPSFDTLYEFEYNTPGNFVYSPDGRFLYGSSYYTGVSNLFRYDTRSKQMEVISNAETGLFRPLPLPDASLLAFEYTSKGFVPARVPDLPLTDVSSVKYLGMALLEKEPVLRSWKLKPSSTIDSASLITRSGSYEPLRNLKLISAFPIIQGYKSSTAAGMRVEVADRLRLAGVNVTATYSPDTSLAANERLHVTLDSHLWDWRLSGYYNNADFYDLFGPTKVSRKGYSLKLGRVTNLIYENPRTLQLDWSVAGYGGIERLPEYQNVAAPYRNLLTANMGLKYSFLERSQGAVDDEKGTQWGVFSQLNYAGANTYPRLWATYDRGYLLPLKNSSAWVRSSVGKSFGDQTNPLANFYFGDFGNNYVDRGSVDRYRDYYSFPGLPLNRISGSSFAKVTGEWNLPPVRFRKLGATWFYSNWTRLSLFSSGLSTNIGSAEKRQSYADVGSQVDIRLVLFTYLNTTLSLGYAGASDQHGRLSTGYVISLKLL